MTAPADLPVDLPDLRARCGPVMDPVPTAIVRALIDRVEAAEAERDTARRALEEVRLWALGRGAALGVHGQHQRMLRIIDAALAPAPPTEPPDPEAP